jgi:hypothetical protein
MFAWRAYRVLASDVNETNRRLAETLARLDTRLEQGSDVIERNTRALRDMRDQVRANTEATLRLLDRLDGGESTA